MNFILLKLFVLNSINSLEYYKHHTLTFVYFGNRNMVTTITTLKKAGIDKKKVLQTKLSFSPAATETKTSKWANIPPLDPNEDPQKSFDETALESRRSKVYIGAHISANGGPEYSVTNAFNISGQAFALFLKNQRRWNCAPLTPESIQKFKDELKKCNYDPKFILPHGSFLINIANPDPVKRKRAFDNFVDDLTRCEELGIPLYNFHPGSTCGLCPKEEGIINIATCINEAMRLTSSVRIVLENAAGQRNVIGSKFEDLRDIISLVKDKSRIGVCLDTCHLFAAGYDIRTVEGFERVMDKFTEIVGLEYLCAVHLNDCKSDLGSGLDRHENIGKGTLTRETFRFIMNSGYFENMPVILETPDTKGDETIYKQELKFLYTLFED